MISMLIVARFFEVDLPDDKIMPMAKIPILPSKQKLQLLYDQGLVMEFAYPRGASITE